MSRLTFISALAYFDNKIQYLLNVPAARTRSARWPCMLLHLFGTIHLLIRRYESFGRFRTAIRYTHCFRLVFINWSRDWFHSRDYTVKRLHLRFTQGALTNTFTIIIELILLSRWFSQKLTTPREVSRHCLVSRQYFHFLGLGLEGYCLGLGLVSRRDIYQDSWT